MKVLFVCTGNTCRSPMAAGIMRYLAEKKGLNIEVESAGLAANYDDAATKDAVDALMEKNIDISSHRSKPITYEMIDQADIVFCMTFSHKYALSTRGVDPKKLRTFAKSIHDPFGCGIEIYRLCRDDIFEALDEEIEKINFLYNGFSVREAKESDLEKIAEIERECFSKPWSKEAIIESFIRENHFFVAEAKGGEIAGYGSFSVVLDEAYINNIATLKGYRKLGVGSKILEKIIEKAREKKCLFLSLEVRESNEAAKKLYEKYNFGFAGKRRNFYSDPKEDAEILTLRFKED